MSLIAESRSSALDKFNGTGAYAPTSERPLPIPFLRPSAPTTTETAVDETGVVFDLGMMTPTESAQQAAIPVRERIRDKIYRFRTDKPYRRRVLKNTAIGTGTAVVLTAAVVLDAHFGTPFTAHLTKITPPHGWDPSYTPPQPLDINGTTFLPVPK